MVKPESIMKYITPASLIIASNNMNNTLIDADFKIIKPSNVNISITDLQGKVVKNVTNQYYVPGQHNIDVSINDLNTGIYLYNISTEFGSATKKFIVN